MRLRYVASAALVLVLRLGPTPQSAQRPPQTTIVQFFTDDFCLNLHHFLYVLGRAEAKYPDSQLDGVNEAPPDQERGLASLSADDQKIWRDAVTAYATSLSRRDLVSSRELVTLTGALANLSDGARLESASPAIDATVAATFNRAAPIYRKVWWPAHHRANQQWADAMRPVIDRHGPVILAFMTKVYGLSWPASGYPVHLSGYSNWAGAYSTSGPLLVVASLDKGNAGEDGLELIFHESMHQWDDPVLTKLQEIGTTLGKKVPPSLTHALIWMTAGEAIRRVLPDHVPMADRGIWQRADYPTIKPALDTAWMPYLKGTGTRDEALLAVMKLVGR
jgi:hypothetical protein